MKYIKYLFLLTIANFSNFSLCTSSLLTCGKNATMQEQEENEYPAVANLREYLRIDTSHPRPEPGYRQAIQWLSSQANEIGLKVSVVDIGSKNSWNKAMIMTWVGRDPSLKSILFNNHMDVVAAEPEKWKYPPFAACKDESGNIFARGAIDMKAYTVGVLEAIRRLKIRKFQPLRTIHITVLPDEEQGGLKGMRLFVESKHFKNLNVGLGIDECGGNWRNGSMRICYAEKASWQFNVTTKGEPGHGAWFPEHTAGHRLNVVLDRMMEFRRRQYDKLERYDLSLDQITTVNLVGLGGGTATNIIAGELWAAFDMRIRQYPNWTFNDVEHFIQDILEEARLGSTNPDDVSVKFVVKTLETGETVVNDTNVWWTVLQDSCKELDISCPPGVMNAFTDARYIRNLGIPVFGLAPFLNTPGTAHKQNEFINEYEFIRGIQRYFVLIRRLAMTPEFPTTL